jgi:hypothetical protein
MPGALSLRIKRMETVTKRKISTPTMNLKLTRSYPGVQPTLQFKTEICSPLAEGSGYFSTHCLSTRHATDGTTKEEVNFTG